MIFMQTKLIVTFDRLSAADFLAKSDSIVTCMTDNSHYQEPWAGLVVPNQLPPKLL